MIYYYINVRGVDLITNLALMNVRQWKDYLVALLVYKGLFMPALVELVGGRCGTVFILCIGGQFGRRSCDKSFVAHASQQITLHSPFSRSSMKFTHRILKTSGLNCLVVSGQSRMQSVLIIIIWMRLNCPSLLMSHLSHNIIELQQFLSASKGS